MFIGTQFHYAHTEFRFEGLGFKVSSLGFTVYLKKGDAIDVLDNERAALYLLMQSSTRV